MFSVTWQGVLLGVLVGVICLLGLGSGLRILLDNIPDETSSKPVNKGKLIWGATLLAGQLIVALALLYFTRKMVANPMGTAVGLLISIFIGSFFLRNIRAKK